MGRGAAVVEVMVDADLNSETVKERVLDPQSRVAIHSDTQESSESSQKTLKTPRAQRTADGPFQKAPPYAPANWCKLLEKPRA